MAKKGIYTYEWPRPMVTVDTLVFTIRNNQLQVLLIQRGQEPFKGLWAIPGGFIEMDEDLIDAACRELMEETSLAGIELEQFHTFGQPGRDPRGRQITVVFIGAASPEAYIKAGDDAQNVQWFNVHELPNMAFDHEMIIGMSLDHASVICSKI